MSEIHFGSALCRENQDEVLWQRTGQERVIGGEIQRRTWRWFGHTLWKNNRKPIRMSHGWKQLGTVQELEAGENTYLCRREIEKKMKGSPGFSVLTPLVLLMMTYTFWLVILTRYVRVG